MDTNGSSTGHEAGLSGSAPEADPSESRDGGAQEVSARGRQAHNLTRGEDAHNRSLSGRETCLDGMEEEQADIPKGGLSETLVEGEGAGESDGRKEEPYTMHPTPYTPNPTPYTLHPTPYTLHPAPYALHPTPYTLHPTPYTLHPTPVTRRRPGPQRRVRGETSIG